MISFFRAVGLLNSVVVFSQVRIELIGFTSDKTIKTVVALLKRPLTFIGTGRKVSFRNIMVLS
jgi:hypothetical protein